MTVRTLPSYYSPTGFQKLTVSSSSVGLTIPVAPQCRAVIFTVESNQIRMRVDGSAVTATDGILLYVGDVVEVLNVDMINNCRLIAVGSDATIQIHYFGGGV